MTTWSCEKPTAPTVPKWKTSTTNSISIEWNPPTDNGGCSITQYQVYRDDGSQSGPVTTPVQIAQLTGINYTT